ncbi:MAG: hypothetical protein JWR26_274 [Pedosphaera sp.]|nr:hypothetical protein [Pedosphaera sp.]
MPSSQNSKSRGRKDTVATTEALPELPALRSLGELADAKPVVVVDTREQLPLVFTRLQAVRGSLYTGDYSLVGFENSFAIERKSIQDLVGCCVGENRERFERELLRLRGFRFQRLLVVGTRDDVERHGYRSKVTPKAILSTLSAFEVRYDVPVVWCASPEAAAVQVESWIWWYAREAVKVANGIVSGAKIHQNSHESN